MAFQAITKSSTRLLRQLFSASVVALLILYPREAFVSGMASVLVVSKRVTVSLDTGVRVSIDGDAGDYFAREESGLLGEVATLLPVVDAWAEQASDQLLSLSPSSRLTELQCGELEPRSLRQLSVEVAIRGNPNKQQVETLRGALCKWLADHPSRSSPASVVSVDGERRKATFGEFYQRDAYLRADLADEWRRIQTLELERWMTVIEKAVKAVETKLGIKLQPRHQSGRSGRGIVTATNGISAFDALFDPPNEELRMAVVNAFYYEHAIAERNAGYDTRLPDGTADYLATRPATAADRESAANTMIELRKRLSAAYAPYGVPMTLGERGGWDENRRLCVHMSLFERLIKEASHLGPQMKKNKVVRIRFSGTPWTDDEQKKSIEMRVHTANQPKDEESSFDIGPSTLSTTEKRFMQFLLGEPR